MINEIAHFALILAFALSIAGALCPLFGDMRRMPGLMAIVRPLSIAQFGLVLFAFGALTYGFVTSDFSLQLVLLNSHTLKPMLYKISGVWGNHEGSLLLWVLILTGFATSAVFFGRGLPFLLQTRVLAVQSAIACAFLAFMLFTSNPFTRVEVPPFNGQGLNPLLQDPGLAFHPPFLYLGYVGLSMAFSFAIAALWGGQVDAAWARWVRPWTLAAWMFLTIGIGLGSWWAYYELGWGGFWFWDPVENASFMPWLLAAALLHSAIVVEKREALKTWAVLLAILAFAFSLIGTFIVRSGVITSVHAFANDPERGVFILLILAIFVGGALLLYAWRAQSMEGGAIFSLLSRESALVMNNILLAVACFVVFVGTVWPLVAELLFARKLSVGPPFFNLAFTPFMVGIALILPFGAVLGWKRGKLGPWVPRLLPAMILAVTLGGLAWAMQSGRSLLGPIGLMLAIWLIAGTLTELWFKAGTQHRLQRLAGLPRAEWGKAIAHIGFGVTVFAVAGLMAWEVEDIQAMRPGDQGVLGGYTIQLVEVAEVTGPNYFAERADILVFRGDTEIATLHPERRFYPVAQMPTTEAGILNGFLRDIYVVMGERQADGSWAIRSFVKPLANWIWGGAILMALGAFVSLTDRRYRRALGRKRAT